MKTLARSNNLSLSFLIVVLSYVLALIGIFSGYYFVAIGYELVSLAVLVNILRRRCSFLIALKINKLFVLIYTVSIVIATNVVVLAWFSLKGHFGAVELQDLIVLVAHFIVFLLAATKFVGAHFGAQNTVAIYGAGVAGRQILRDILSEGNYLVLFFIDDDSIKKNRLVDGLNVFSRDDFKEMKLFYVINSVFISIPTIENNELISLIASLEGLDVAVKKLPKLEGLPLQKANQKYFSEIDETDLIGRHAALPDYDILKRTISGKIVLVTGAGGSIGSAICFQVLKLSPAKLVLFDVSEYALYQVHRRILDWIDDNNIDVPIIATLGSIQSLQKVESLFLNHKIDTVYHAAAYKHVALIQSNLLEGFKNNVLGTKNLVSTAVNNKVENFVMVSSDKAVRPTNFMGVTKRLCELVCQSHSENSFGTVISMVRFGNVFGSSGSVVPLFKEQISVGGPLTVTHPDITRYFMTVDEAAELVIQAAAMAVGGEVFVLDMGEPIKILDLAKRMILLSGKTYIFENDCDDSREKILIKFTGLRPGEKMYEELFLGGSILSTSHPQINKSQYEYHDFDVVNETLNKLKDSLERELDLIEIKEIVNVLDVSFQPSENMRTEIPTDPEALMKGKVE